LFKPRSAAEGAPKRYSATLIFDKKDRPALETKVLEVLKEEFGDKAIQMAKSGLIKSPFLAGDSKEARNKQTGEIHPGLGADKFFIRVSANEDRPPFVIWKDPNHQETEDTVYSGVYGKAVVNIFAWSHPANGKGVSFGIQGFQRLQDGERLGGDGKADPTKWAETIEDAGDAPAETKSGAGASALFGE
jgi:hypothetical protein